MRQQQNETKMPWTVMLHSKRGLYKVCIFHGPWINDLVLASNYGQPLTPAGRLGNKQLPYLPSARFLSSWDNTTDRFNSME